MTRSRSIHASLRIISLLSLVAFTGDPTFSQESRKSIETVNSIKSDEILSFVQDKKILNVFYWEQQDKEPYLCITSMASATNDNGTTIIFRIYNNERKIVYEQDLTGAGEIQRIYSVHALRNGRSQLAVEIRLDGSDRFLYLFDNRDGHLINLIPHEHSDFNITCEIKPQFLSTENIRRLPFQIYLTSQIGSISAPKTVILSLKGEHYAYERTVETSKLGSTSIEK